MVSYLYTRLVGTLYVDIEVSLTVLMLYFQPGVFSITQPPMYAPFSTDSLPTATDVPRYTYGQSLLTPLCHMTGKL